jgi:RND family efflux transporter MFP subunit
MVVSRSMVIGQNIDTSAVLARLDNLDRVYVDAQVYEKDLGGVHVDDPVQVTVSAIPNQSFGGHVKWIASEINPDTRTVTVRTELPNPGWQLRPGMFAAVDIGSRSRIKGVSVPADAILQEGDKTFAYVQVANNEFVKRNVKTGPAVGGQTPVASGLSPGDKVVVAGNVLIEKEQDSLESDKSGGK